MPMLRRIGWFTVLCLTSGVAHGQGLTPLGDPVWDSLVPSGISRLPVRFNGQLAHVFEDEVGTEAIHIIGDFVATIGEKDGQTLRSREAVIWIVHGGLEGRPCRCLEILLWQDAQITETAGTVTSGPALFVTLSTSGEITTEVDDIAFQPPTDSPAYREGLALRGAAVRDGQPATGEDTHLRVYDASGLSGTVQQAAPRPLIHVRSEGELVVSEVEGGGQVLTVAGGVYLSRGGVSDDDFLEVQADSVVVFLPRGGGGTRREEPGVAGLGGEAQPSRSPGWEEPSFGIGGRDASERQRLSTGFGEVEVEAAYLEGDVVMAQGPNTIRASKLYYDFLDDRALILDAVVRTSVTQRSIPLYVRASEIRQLSRNRFTAQDAMLTTSEFHTPHYHVGVERVELVNRTPLDITGQQRGLRAGTFSIRHATLNVEGKPILYWPYVRGRIDASETSIKSLRTGYSDDFGVELESEWQFFNVLGLETPDGFDSTLSLDFFSERGPAVGIDADYTRDTYFGLVRSYLLWDSDEDFLGRDREEPSIQDIRGRFLLRHRHYLQDDWELSLELSYISDSSFLEEFFESEFDNEKEQETLFRLKKQRANWAFTVTTQPRILDFTTQTERLPEFTYHVVGEPVGDFGTWYGENRLGIVRLRPGHQTFRELLRDGRIVGSGSVARSDSRHEIGIPLDVGPLRFVPFVGVRTTSWDDSPGSGGLSRVLVSCGLRGSMYLERVYPDARSSLFDIDGIRHVIKPDITAWVAGANRQPDELFRFDDTVEGVGETDGVALGLRQRWQTKRGAGATRRTVDFLTLDVEVGLFNDAPGEIITNGYGSFSRPENSLSRNYVNSSAIWRLNDRTALLSEMNYDVNDGEVDIFNVSVAVERTPRLSYLLGYRLIEETDSELLGFDLNYRLSEKHTLAIREAFDLAEGRSLDFTVALIRKFPGWFGAVSFALDEPEDDFGVSISIWPQGVPEATLGSRRFAGLGSTMRLQQN